MLMIAYHRELDNIVERAGSDNSFDGLKTIFGKPDEFPQFEEFLWEPYLEGVGTSPKTHRVTRIDGSGER